VLRPGTLLALVPSLALGAAFEIDARTEAQVSQIRDWRNTDATTPQLLPRRELVQYLGVNAYELLPNAPLGFESSVRVFADFGLPQGEAARIDGLKTADADLLFANVFYKGKELDFRLGRQIYTDMTTTFAFDGAWVRYVKRVGPLGIGAEAFAGLWVKAGAALGSSVYQPDGIRESDLRRLMLSPSTVAPYAALDDIEPVVGANVLMQSFYGVSLGAGFKQSWLSGLTDIRRLDAYLKWTGMLGLSVVAGIDYDLLLMRVANARWQVRLDRNEVSLSAEYLRVSPLLSADSIFYYFTNAPRDGGRIRADWFPTGILRFSVQGLVDVYSTPLNPATGIGAWAYPPPGFPAPPGVQPPSLSYGGGGGALMHAGPVRVLLDGTFKTGYGGQQVWVNLSGGYVPPGAKVTAEARVSVANVSDVVNPLYKGTYAGFQLWGSWAPTRTNRISVVLEQNFGPATQSDTKLFVLYDLKAVFEAVGAGPKVTEAGSGAPAKSLN
jgi:hypothetical protein